MGIKKPPSCTAIRERFWSRVVVEAPDLTLKEITEIGDHMVECQSCHLAIGTAESILDQLSHSQRFAGDAKDPCRDYIFDLGMKKFLELVDYGFCEDTQNQTRYDQ